MVGDIIQPLRPLPLRREARLLAGAARVTIVSKAWASNLDARFNIRSKLKVVTNGYDPEEVTDVKPQGFGHFAIVTRRYFLSAGKGYHARTLGTEAAGESGHIP